MVFIATAAKHVTAFKYWEKYVRLSSKMEREAQNGGLEQRLANFFCEGLDGKYFTLCGPRAAQKRRPSLFPPHPLRQGISPEPLTFFFLLRKVCNLIRRNRDKCKKKQNGCCHLSRYSRLYEITWKNVFTASGFVLTCYAAIANYLVLQRGAMMGREGGGSAKLLQGVGGHTERQGPRLTCWALVGSGASPPGSEARGYRFPIGRL